MAGGLRWTPEEDELFVQGLKAYGDGKWTRIAEMIGTRTALQVKNRARHVIEYDNDSELSRILREMRLYRGEPQIQKRSQRRTKGEISMYEGVSDEVDDAEEGLDDIPPHSLSAPTPRRSPRRDRQHAVPVRHGIKRVHLSVSAEDQSGDVQVEDEAVFATDIDINEGPESGPEEDLFQAPNRRRSRQASGYSLGCTIVHEPPAVQIRRSDRKQGKRAVSEDAWSSNPFRLVPPVSYNELAPFRVIVAPQVLITMDFHAHMSVAEVIGLLGGKFESESGTLYVLSIYPCKSIGTRKECEMDPVSEMEAVSQFAALDLQPVGWYHSHPTFEPSPSCRDIETQSMYQSLFSRPSDNAEPFLGFIISPFLRSSKGRSVVECIHLSRNIAPDEQFRQPCRIDYVIDDTGEFFEYPDDLVDLYEKLQLTYMRSSNYAGLFHEVYFINKLTARLENCSYEPSARALLQSLGLGQVQVKGRFQETVQQLFLHKAHHNIPIFRPLKPINNAAEWEREERDARGTGYLKPFRFAENAKIQLDVKEHGHWEEITALDGTPLKIWQAIVASDDALSLSVQFEDFHLSESAEFYIRGRDTLAGAFTPEENNQPDGKFATAPITGDFLGLLIALPASNLEQAQKDLQFRIRSLAHGFRPFPKDFQDSAKQIRAVAMLMTYDGTRFCSGTMINNSARNQRQLFLTANHCMGTDPSLYVAVFNYQHSACNRTSVEPSTLQSARGMKLISKWASSDFALLEIIEKIPNSYKAYLAGWNMNNRASSKVFGIHHPLCDVKKVSFFDGTLIAQYWDEYPKKLHWMVSAWTRGTTEPGSSGSGLFTSNGQLIGQLHGGAAACDNPTGYDLFGGIFASWNGGGTASTRLREYLNPRGLWISSLDGMELQR